MASPWTKALEKAKQLYVSLSGSRYDVPYLVSLLLLEAVLCSAILKFVPYTEIDWEAYMQEVDLWQGGELDYRKIRGGTGPLVYPAGFLYLYGWLRRITNQGDDVAKAQLIFLFLYIINAAIVLAIYSKVARRIVRQSNSSTDIQRATLLWSWRIAMGLCCLSKRMHSIFILRLFNDGPAMLLFYLATWFFANSSMESRLRLFFLGSLHQDEHFALCAGIASLALAELSRFERNSRMLGRSAQPCNLCSVRPFFLPIQKATFEKPLSSTGSFSTSGLSTGRYDRREYNAMVGTFSSLVFILTDVHRICSLCCMV